MTESTVVLTALGIIASCLAALVWIVKFLMREIKTSLDKNTASHEKVAEATSVNTQVSHETLTFMKNLNGRLAEITADKAEQRRAQHDH